MDKEEKTRKVQVYRVISNEEFVHALDEKAAIIIAEGNLYEELLQTAQKVKGGKTLKTVGKVTAATSFLLLSGPIGWIGFGGGLAGYFVGRSRDNLKNYKVQIDEVCKRLIFWKCKGINKCPKREIRSLLS